MRKGGKFSPFIHVAPALFIPVFAFVLTLFSGFQPVWALEFRQPDCASLEKWTAGTAPKETYSIAPQVEITALLQDEQTRPLFGSTVEEWGNDQFNALGRWLQSCRQAAIKRKDMAAGKNLYTAMKTIRRSSSTLYRAARMQKSAEDKVQALLDFPPAPGVPEVVAMAQDALRGEDVRPRIATIRDSREAIMAASNIDGIQQAYGYLPEAKRNALIARLDRTREVAQAKVNELDEEMLAAREKLAAAPFTEEGLRAVVSLSQLPVLDKVNQNDARAFRNAVQQKRWAIQKALEQKKARQAAVEAAKPIAIESRLEELFVGTRVKDLSIRGLEPGMTKDQTENKLRHGWRYEYNSLGLIAGKPWLPVREDGPRYKSERRDGGMANFDVMDNDRVGQIDFIEHYKGMVISSTPQAWLTARIGKPDQVGGTAVARLMTWHQGSRHLQVRVAGQVEVIWANAGFQSQMEISLWNDDYEDYLDKLNRRCIKIRQKPRNEWSMDESLLFGKKCPLTADARLTPGL